MSPLGKKLLRDLWRIKSQAAAIAAVIAVGVMMLVMMSGLVTSLQETRQAYYQKYRLAEAFAPIVRAPEAVVAKLKSIPGVALVETRVTGSALVDLAAQDLPVQVRVVSLPDYGEPALNAVFLTAGQTLTSARDNDVLVLESFARANGLNPGDHIRMTINGARRDLRVAGWAQSPEFLYTAAPGQFVSDDSKFGVIWMKRSSLAASYDMEGAFNEALFKLQRGQDPKPVLTAIDTVLDPYGSLGAYDRPDLISDRFVQQEIESLRMSTRVLPPIFQTIAAFLLYIVIGRIIQTEREEIGLMKAFGLTSFEIATHYMTMILIIAGTGAIAGCLLGILSGRGMVEIYLTFFKFPFLVFQLDPKPFLIGVATSIAAASAGGLIVLRRIFRLNPAVAMRPPAPADFSRGMRFDGVWSRVLDQPTRIVLRRFVRQPVRMGGAVLGVACGMAISSAMAALLAGFTSIVGLTFSVIDRSDISVFFSHPRPERVVHSMSAIEGVQDVEPVRFVPVILKNGRNTYRGEITGLSENARLFRAVDSDEKPIFMREDGIILSPGLARKLDLQPGQTLLADVREGSQPVLELPVVAIAETSLGSPAYMQIDALNRALSEPGRISGAFVKIDTAHADAIYRELKDMPAVAGVSLKEDSRSAFQRLIDEGAGSNRFIMFAVSAIITFGVVYNTARIAFAEQARDLAGMKVLGFSENEAAFVLFGELALVTLIAIPVGAAGGFGLSFLVTQAFSTDLYQIKMNTDAASYGVAMLTVVSSAIFSGWVVKRDLKRADLVAVLKSRD